MLKECDILGCSANEKKLIPFCVEDAMRYFLEREEFLLEPHLLNPFLKCLENMKSTVDIKLNYTLKREPFYTVSFKHEGKMSEPKGFTQS